MNSKNIANQENLDDEVVKKPSTTSKKMPKIGIIMLNTSFPRPIGDVGNLDSYRYPAHILQLQKANVSNVVNNRLSEELLQEVIFAANQLKKLDINIITTSCGFLAPIQQTVQESVGLPFIASSLGLLPFLRQIFGHKNKIAVLTFDSQVLNIEHFNGNFDSELLISGIENGEELHPVIKHSLSKLDAKKAQQDVFVAVDNIIQSSPVCILLECTNLSPYKEAIRQKYQLPVFDLVDAVHWLADAY